MRNSPLDREGSASPPDSQRLRKSDSHQGTYERDEWIPYEQQGDHKSPPTEPTALNENENTHPQWPQPPPPPPVPKSSTSDDFSYSPKGNGYRKYSTEGPLVSPGKLRLDRANSRKRDYDARDSSDDEREYERRRQIDDVTPKLKRRQPKVAEAYR